MRVSSGRDIENDIRVSDMTWSYDDGGKHLAPRDFTASQRILTIHCHSG